MNRIDSDDDLIEINTENSRENSSVSYAIKKFLAIIGHVFTDGELKAAAWAVGFAVIREAFFSSKKEDQEEDSIPTDPLVFILASVIVWQFFASLGMTVQYYLIAARATGEADQEIDALPEGINESALKAGAIYLASTTEFADSFLSGLDIYPFKIQGVLLGVTLGTAWWLKCMLSDMQAAHRKYIESHPDDKPLAQQKYFRWLYQHSKKIAGFLRETLGPVLGSLHMYVFLNLLMELQGFDHNKMSSQEKFSFALPYLPLLFMVYEGGALIANNFDVRQMKDNLHHSGIDIEKTSLLLRSKYRLLRWTGNMLHGEILTESVHQIGQQCNVSSESQVASLQMLAGFFNALGLGALFHRGLNDYISSPDPLKGLLFTNWFGPEKAVEIATYSTYVEFSLSVLGAIMQSYAKKSSLSPALQELQTRHVGIFASSLETSLIHDVGPTNDIELVSELERAHPNNP